MEIVGIDIGTTSICGVSVDTETGAVLRSRTVDSRAFIVSEKSFEKIQSPERIVTLATEILREMVTESTAVIGVTGQMHGIVYTSADGEAVSPLYTWQDGRGDLPYKDTTYAKFLGGSTGYGSVTDFYNRENGLRPSEAVSYCTIHDYFVMKLCGLRTPLIHASDAASFGCYDLSTGRSDCESNVETVSGYSVAGEYRGIPVGVAIGDNQASVFSTVADENDLLINVGTGSQVSVISSRISASEGVETRPYFEGKYLTVGAALCGGRAFSMLKDFYREILSYKGDVSDGEVYGIMSEMLTGIQRSTLRVDTRFAGTRQDPTVCGSISGITVQNFNAPALTLGVLQGMVGELYGLYTAMGEKKSGIVASGNGIRKNPHLVRLAEERFGMKLKIPAHVEEAAFGVALFGAISGGVFRNAAEAQRLIRYEA